jgi:hypothetical protein
MIEIGINEKEAKRNCIRLSKEHKGMYVYAYTSFGLYATIEKRLHIYAPSDCIFNWYTLNGKVKKFTESQKIADQNATPLGHQ